MIQGKRADKLLKIVNVPVKIEIDVDKIKGAKKVLKQR